jgi:hypothetical protein
VRPPRSPRSLATPLTSSPYATRAAMRRRLDALTGAKLEAQAKAAQEAQALIIETKAAIDSARLRVQEAERALLRVGSQENSNALTEAQADLTMNEQRHALAVREAGNASADLTSAIAAERGAVVDAVLSDVASAAQQSDVVGMVSSITDAIHQAAQIVRAALAPGGGSGEQASAPRSRHAHAGQRGRHRPASAPGLPRPG